MPALKLIVGLGNPGPEYEVTRHNAGFWFADHAAEREHAHFSLERGFRAEVAKAGGLWFMKPQTYMNRSGQAVGAFARFYRIAPEEILVAHDELDLMPGDVKLKNGGGTAGHNGLKDIAAQLGTPDFWRLRIGIGHPRTLNLQQQVADFVLHPPRKDEMPGIEKALFKALEVLPQMKAGEFEAAMMQLHRKA